MNLLMRKENDSSRVIIIFLCRFGSMISSVVF